MHLNVAFDRGTSHTLNGWRTSASNPPFADWVMRLRSSGASQDVRDAAAEVLCWALDNVQFVKSDRLLLEGELRSAGYLASPPAPAPSIAVPGRGGIRATIGALLFRIGRRMGGGGQGNQP